MDEKKPNSTNIVRWIKKNVQIVMNEVFFYFLPHHRGGESDSSFVAVGSTCSGADGVVMATVGCWALKGFNCFIGRSSCALNSFTMSTHSFPTTKRAVTRLEEFHHILHVLRTSLWRCYVAPWQSFLKSACNLIHFANNLIHFNVSSQLKAYGDFMQHYELCL